MFQGCSKYFETKSHLQQHEYELDLNKSDFPCSVCHHSLENATSLASHIASHALQVSHQCPVCFLGFKDAFVANEHAKSHDLPQQ